MNARNPAPSARCPLVSTLDIVGDRWSLVILRDIIAGRHRFGEFLQSAERIPTNILAARLRHLGTHGIVRRVPYQEKPPRHEYRLTRKGADLLPAIQALARFGCVHDPRATRPPQRFFRMSSRQLADREAPVHEPTGVATPDPATDR